MKIVPESEKLWRSVALVSGCMAVALVIVWVQEIQSPVTCVQGESVQWLRLGKPSLTRDLVIPGCGLGRPSMTLPSSIQKVFNQLNHWLPGAEQRFRMTMGKRARALKVSIGKGPSGFHNGILNLPWNVVRQPGGLQRQIVRAWMAVADGIESMPEILFAEISTQLFAQVWGDNEIFDKTILLGGRRHPDPLFINAWDNCDQTWLPIERTSLCLRGFAAESHRVATINLGPEPLIPPTIQGPTLFDLLSQIPSLYARLARHVGALSFVAGQKLLRDLWERRTIVVQQWAQLSDDILDQQSKSLSLGTLDEWKELAVSHLLDKPIRGGSHPDGAMLQAASLHEWPIVYIDAPLAANKKFVKNILDGCSKYCRVSLLTARGPVFATRSGQASLLLSFVRSGRKNLASRREVTKGTEATSTRSLGDEGHLERIRIHTARAILLTPFNYKISQLLALLPESDQVMVVKISRSQKVFPGIVEYFSRDAQQFARHNKSFNFVELQLTWASYVCDRWSSWCQSNGVFSLSPLSSIAQKTPLPGQHVWQRPWGEDVVVWHPRLKAYRIRGSAQVVSWLRL